MKINIQLSGIAAELINNTQISIEKPASLKALHGELVKMNAGLEKYSLHFSVNELKESLDYKLKDIDNVLVFNPFAGG
jgi:molybdopterin converting factor small subunit